MIVYVGNDLDYICIYANDYNSLLIYILLDDMNNNGRCTQ